MKRKYASQSHAFFDGFLAGMAAGNCLFSPRVVPRIDMPESETRPSDREAMRGDWLRIGGDFRRVIERETTSEK